MAVLNLTKVWINRLDSGLAVSAQSDPTRTRVHAVDGEVSTWAGGRQRASVAEGERGSFSVTLVLLSLSTVETLRSWKGAPVQVRDARGQKFFGVFFAVPIKERREAGYYDVELQLSIVTVTEGV